MKTNTIFAALALCLVACPPAPPAPMPPDASDASPTPPPPAPSASIVLACSNMKAAGCPEGLAADCAATIAHTLEAGITKIDVACLSSATTVSAVQACGVACKK